MAVLAQRVKNKFRGLMVVHGSVKAKQNLWDEEFANGRWDCLDTTTNDCVYSRLETWTRGGSILDLGCGSGSTANEVAEGAFREYTGVDISEVAIEKARKRTEANGRGRKCRFMRGDVMSFEPSEKADVILFRDSIYYMQASQVKSVLMRYAQWLAKDGVFVVRFWNAQGKQREFADAILSNFDILEEYWPDETGTLVLVFRCRADGEQAEA